MSSKLMAVYSHASPERLAEAGRALDNIFRGQRPMEESDPGSDVTLS